VDVASLREFCLAPRGGGQAVGPLPRWRCRRPAV